jgi:hypothetical protein
MNAPVDLLLSRFIELGSHQMEDVDVDPVYVSTVDTIEGRRTCDRPVHDGVSDRFTKQIDETSSAFNGENVLK